MGHFIIKADRDRDLYMDWSTIVELPTFIGTRAEIIDHLKWWNERRPLDNDPEARVRRADETGSSARRDPRSSYDGPLEGAWDDKGFIIEQRGWLPRARLAEFLDTYRTDPEKSFKLLDPFEED